MDFVIEGLLEFSLQEICLGKEFKIINPLVMKPISLFLFLFTAISYSLLAQKTHELQFNGDGLMTSAPPSLLERGDYIKVRVNTDQAFWETRINAAIERYLLAIENIKKDKYYKMIDTKTAEAELEKVKCSICFEVNKTIEEYVKPENKYTLKQRLNLAGCDLKSSKCSDISINALESFIKPEFKLFITFHDKNGNRIYKKKEEYELNAAPNIPATTTTTTPAKTTITTIITRPNTPAALKNTTFYETVDKIAVEENFYELKYELRLKNSLNTVIQNKLKEKTPKFPDNLPQKLKDIEKKLNKNFFIDYESLKKRALQAEENLKNGTTVGIDSEWIALTNNIKDRVKNKVDSSFLLINEQPIKDWILGWMWLTQGLPKINPFDFQNGPSFPSTTPVKKVTEEEKELLVLFEKLIDKQSFELGTVSVAFSDDKLNQMASIKARLEAEKKTITNKDDNNYDILLYKGLLKTCKENSYAISLNAKERNYMVSHDATNNFISMNNSYVKEITENDKLFVFLNNKKTDDKFKIEVTPILITQDLSIITDEIFLSNGTADIAEDKSKSGDIKERLKILVMDYDELNDKILYIVYLSKSSIQPVEFIKDETPYLVTENLIYNYQLKAPATAEYKIKVVKTDSAEEVYKGEFRINKLYNLRFKAGLVYSGLTKHDYTVTSTNTFTDTKEDYGLDGTFGVQIFPKKTDMRDINITKGKFPPFLYLGLSMKNIQENFYVGTGFEIFSGLSIMYMGHIGRTEQLVGEGAILTGTRNAWKWGNGAAITIDGALFVNLFKFGSNKSLLGIQ